MCGVAEPAEVLGQEGQVGEQAARLLRPQHRVLPARVDRVAPRQQRRPNHSLIQIKQPLKRKAGLASITTEDCSQNCFATKVSPCWCADGLDVVLLQPEPLPRQAVQVRGQYGRVVPTNIIIAKVVSHDHYNVGRLPGDGLQQAGQHQHQPRHPAHY